MKRFALLALCCLLSLGTFGCSRVEEPKQVSAPAPDPFAKAWAYYGKQRNIRRLFSAQQSVTMREGAKGEFSGGFFLFLGGVAGSYKEGSSITTSVTQVRFAWDTGDRGYMITTLPLEKVMIKPMPKGTHPSVQFVFTPTSIHAHAQRLVSTAENGILNIPQALNSVVVPMLNNTDEPEEAFAKLLSHAILFVPENLWPESINVPLGGLEDK